jgi:hypothetical protein
MRKLCGIRVKLSLSQARCLIPRRMRLRRFLIESPGIVGLPRYPRAAASRRAAALAPKPQRTAFPRACGDAGDQGRFVNGEALTSPAQ